MQRARAALWRRLRRPSPWRRALAPLVSRWPWPLGARGVAAPARARPWPWPGQWPPRTGAASAGALSRRSTAWRAGKPRGRSGARLAPRSLGGQGSAPGQRRPGRWCWLRRWRASPGGPGARPGARRPWSRPRGPRGPGSAASDRKPAGSACVTLAPSRPPLVAQRGAARRGSRNASERPATQRGRRPRSAWLSGGRRARRPRPRGARPRPPGRATAWRTVSARWQWWERRPQTRPTHTAHARRTLLPWDHLGSGRRARSAPRRACQAGRGAERRRGWRAWPGSWWASRRTGAWTGSGTASLRGAGRGGRRRPRACSGATPPASRCRITAGWRRSSTGWVRWTGGSRENRFTFASTPCLPDHNRCMGRSAVHFWDGCQKSVEQ
jgi:hypothetical protein